MKKSNSSWLFWEDEYKANDIYFREWVGWDEKVCNFEKVSAVKSNLVYGNHHTQAVVSIIIPSYRRVQGLKRAIDSALRQDFNQPYEIVIIDDSGSCAGDYQKIDALMQVVCKENKNIIYYRNEENLGANDNWNRTMEICKTSWFCMLHDDDEIYPNYLSQMHGNINVFNRNDIALISPFYDLVTERGRTSQSILTSAFGKLLTLRRNKPLVLNINDALHSVFPNTVAMFINKEKAMNIGGLNKKWGVLADSIFFAQLVLEHKTGIFPMKLCLSNKSNDSTSASPLVANYVVMSYFQRTKAIADTLRKTEQKRLRLSSESSVFAELALLNKNVNEINQIRTKLGIKAIYNQSWYKLILKAKKIILWGCLLLRKG